MSDTTSRRGFLSLTGKAAAVAAGAAAVPVICSGAAFAAPGAELPVVTHPRHPGAVYPAGGDGFPEPLNASVHCELSGRRA